LKQWDRRDSEVFVKLRRGPSACCAPVGLVLTRALSSRRKVFIIFLGVKGGSFKKRRGTDPSIVQ
jgi:hypothetical protein